MRLRRPAVRGWNASRSWLNGRWSKAACAVCRRYTDRFAVSFGVGVNSNIEVRSLTLWNGSRCVRDRCFRGTWSCRRRGLQIGVDELNGCGSLPHRRGRPFHRSASDIAGHKHAGHVGFEMKRTAFERPARRRRRKIRSRENDPWRRVARHLPDTRYEVSRR